MIVSKFEGLAYPFPEYYKYIDADEIIAKSIDEDYRRWNLDRYLASRGFVNDENFVSIDEKKCLGEERKSEIISTTHLLFDFFLKAPSDELPENLANAIFEYKKHTIETRDRQEECSDQMIFLQNRIMYLSSWIAQNIVDRNERQIVERQIRSIKGKIFTRNLTRNILKRYLPLLFITNFCLLALFGCSNTTVTPSTPTLVSRSELEFCPIVEDQSVSRGIDPLGETVFTYGCLDGTQRMVWSYGSRELEHLYLSRAYDLGYQFNPDIEAFDISVTPKAQKLRFTVYNLEEDFDASLGVSRALNFINLNFSLDGRSIQYPDIDITIGSTSIYADNRYGSLYLFGDSQKYPKTANDVLLDNLAVGSTVPVGTDGSICLSPLLGKWLMRVDPQAFITFWNSTIEKTGKTGEKTLPSVQVVGEALLVNEMFGIFVTQHSGLNSADPNQIKTFMFDIQKLFQSEKRVFDFPTTPNEYLLFLKTFVNQNPEYWDIYTSMGIPVEGIMQLDEVWESGKEFQFSRDLAKGALQERVFSMFINSLKEAATTELHYRYLESNGFK